MRKILTKIDDCIPGMEIAETIYNDYGVAILSEKTILDTHLIKKLQNLNIDKIKIFEQFIPPNDSELFRIQHNANVDMVKNIFLDITLGEKISTEAVSSVSKSVINRIDENRDIVGCINSIRNVDEYTYSHSVNVSLLCMLIGKWLKFDVKKISQLVEAGLLHDVGKSKIPAAILNKPGKLSKEEFDEIKHHPVIGYRLLEEDKLFDEDVCKGVLMHHEREDGSGYPIGLKGNQIHQFAKIIAVADIYDAMTSTRIYREKESPFKVFELMEDHAFGFLDTIVVRTFLNNIAAYYLGDFVMLNTGEKAEIIYINSRHVSQPVVRSGEKYIDLSIEKSASIVELL